MSICLRSKYLMFIVEAWLKYVEIRWNLKAVIQNLFYSELVSCAAGDIVDIKANPSPNMKRLRFPRYSLWLTGPVQPFPSGSSSLTDLVRLSSVKSAKKRGGSFQNGLINYKHVPR